VGDVLFQDPAQFSGVICCEINFVVGTVKGEPDCFVGVLAGKVIDQLDMYFAGHGGPFCW
jgi:hypothetical protein